MRGSPLVPGRERISYLVRRFFTGGFSDLNSNRLQELSLLKEQIVWMQTFTGTSQKGVFPDITLLKIYFSADCAYTVSGPKPKTKCVFPFRFKGITYNTCTRAGNKANETEAWCSTWVTSTGEHIGNKGNWGNCCPTLQSVKNGK